jgi:hypothetical protein
MPYKVKCPQTISPRYSSGPKIHGSPVRKGYHVNSEISRLVTTISTPCIFLLVLLRGGFRTSRTGALPYPRSEGCSYLISAHQIREHILHPPSRFASSLRRARSGCSKWPCSCSNTSSVSNSHRSQSSGWSISASDSILQPGMDVYNAERL